MTDKLEQIMDEMETSGTLEDRREYVQEDLKQMYSLTDQEADDLYYLVQRKFDPKAVNFYDLKPNELTTAAELIQESIHGGHDGWDSEHDRLVIDRFLNDIALGVRVIMK